MPWRVEQTGLARGPGAVPAEGEAAAMRSAVFTLQTLPHQCDAGAPTHLMAFCIA